MFLTFVVNMHGLFLSKIKKELQLLMLLKNFLDESNCKPIKTWVDKGSEFHDKSMISLLQNSNIEYI